jgi:hypothetical protein
LANIVDLYPEKVYTFTTWSFAKFRDLAHSFASRQLKFEAAKRCKSPANGFRQVPLYRLGDEEVSAERRISLASSSIERP